MSGSPGLVGFVVLLALASGALAPPAGAACGDGILDPGEQCDPGPDVPADCCGATCDLVTDGTGCGAIGGACATGSCVTPAVLTFVRIRARSPGRLNGGIVLRGTFATDPPGDVFGAGAGIALRVTDGLAVDRSVEWTATDCVTFPGGGIRCNRPDGASRKIRADPIPATASWRFVIRFKDLDTVAPFAAPVTLRLTHHTATDRAGSIATCTLAGTALNCRPAS